MESDYEIYATQEYTHHPFAFSILKIFFKLPLFTYYIYPLNSLNNRNITIYYFLIHFCFCWKKKLYILKCRTLSSTSQPQIKIKTRLGERNAYNNNDK